MPKSLDTIVVAEHTSQPWSLHLGADNLEFMDTATSQRLTSALQSLGQSVTWYSSPAEFIDNIHNHANPFVIPLWSGLRTRNRRALLPAICEAKGITYLGADPYAAVICQDKYLSKLFANRFDIATPLGTLVETNNDLQLINHLSLPLVVKPNLQGGSIGIASSNLAYSHSNARSRAAQLLQEYQQPALVEEFVPGEEFSIIVTGSRTTIDFLEGVIVEIPDIDLTANIFSMEIKKDRAIETRHRLATQELNATTKLQITKLYHALGKVDYMRIDGRLGKGKFTLIELTPDVSLKPSATFAAAYELRGLTFEEMMADLTATGLRHRKA